jgi:hypothetical protein
VELSGDQEDACADSREPTITTRFAFSGLKLAVEGLEEAVGHSEPWLSFADNKNATDFRVFWHLSGQDTMIVDNMELWYSEPAAYG